MSARSEARSNFLYNRLITHLKTPLYRNGYFLTLSSLATSGIGLIYWILVAHKYPIYDVGINTAVISSMTFLAGISEINLMSALIRFIPVAGRSTKRFVLYTYLVCLAFAAVISVVYIANLKHWAPALNFLGSNRTLGIWFTISTMMWCIFVLQDSVLTGLRRAAWVPVENIVFSLTKIVIMLIFAVSIPSLGIFASWSFALLVAIVPTNYYIFRKLIPLHTKQESQVNTHIEPGQVIRFAAPDYLGAIFWLICTTLMPVIVTIVSGAKANAYFYLAWTIANTLYLIGPSMGSSLIVEAVNNPQKLMVYSQRVFKNTLKIVFPAAIIIAVGAPLILLAFGRGYSSEGTALLRFLALSAIPNVVNVVFVSVSRVQRRMKAVLITSATLYSMVLGLSFVLLKLIGIAGVGLGWLISQIIIAGIVYFTQLRKLWRNPGEVNPRPKGSILKANGIIFLIHTLYQVAAGLGLIQLLFAIKKKFYMRQRNHKVDDLLPDVINQLPIDIYDPGKDDLKVLSVVNNTTNTAVAFLGASNEQCSLVLKLPGNLKEVDSIQRQIENLDSLCNEEHLGEWRNLLPKIISTGWVDGQFFYAERAMPGITILNMIQRKGDSPDIINLAVAEIGTLHQKTATCLTVGMDMLEEWVNEPLYKLSHYLNSDPGKHTQPQIDRLETELNVALSGHEVSASWIHGDYSPANILINPEGNKITGIIDWDLARPNELPSLDLMHLILSVRMEIEKRELGHIVRNLLLNENWKPEEIELIQTAQSNLPGEPVAMRVLLLLSWLHHIDANLNKTSRYDRNTLWLSENIFSVLKVL